MSSCMSEDVGIIAMEVYFPFLYVDQSELEQFDKVSTGKYTIGLGQEKMGFCCDNEDINSLCLTVTRNLMEKQKDKISYSQIGYLCVGSETVIDKSKSTKTVLMQLFDEHGNNNFCGFDCKSACFGGTGALFSAIWWSKCQSKASGQYALVVMGDIAVYAEGPARCTGGAGAVAILIGPHACLVFEDQFQSCYSAHSYDFYKPNLHSEYPVVDGQQSIHCYLTALDNCYLKFRNVITADKKCADARLTMNDEGGYFCFHTPYTKLVKKSFARLMFHDYLLQKRSLNGLPSEENGNHVDDLFAFSSEPIENLAKNREFEAACLKASEKLFERKVAPTLLLARNIGNMYTASLYGGLASLLYSIPCDKLLGKRIVMFSYGSGVESSMFSFKMTSDRNKCQALCDSLTDLEVRLSQRHKVHAQEFDGIMKLRESVHNKAPYAPTADYKLFPNTYHLLEVDSKYRRRYERIT